MDEERDKLISKVKAYVCQDKKKGRLVKIEYHGLTGYMRKKLTYNDTIDILTRDGLNCYLCRRTVQIITPNETYKKSLLTLDRVDNHDTHNFNNCRVCCFNCNILRSNKYSSSDFKRKFFE